MCFPLHDLSVRLIFRTHTTRGLSPPKRHRYYYNIQMKLNTPRIETSIHKQMQTLKAVQIDNISAIDFLIHLPLQVCKLNVLKSFCTANRAKTYISDLFSEWCKHLYSCLHTKNTIG